MRNTRKYREHHRFASVPRPAQMRGIVKRLRFVLFIFAAMASLVMPARVHAQFGFPPPQPPVNARKIAPLDLTGYWVSIVTEDWRFRMITPDKGDYASVPLNSEGKRVADTWDPAKDERQASNADRMAPPPSCVSLDACTSPGRTTLLCVWKRMPERRLVSSISIPHPRRNRLLNGKAIHRGMGWTPARRLLQFERLWCRGGSRRAGPGRLPEGRYHGNASWISSQERRPL